MNFPITMRSSVSQFENDKDSLIFSAQRLSSQALGEDPGRRNSVSVLG